MRRRFALAACVTAACGSDPTAPPPGPNDAAVSVVARHDAAPAPPRYPDGVRSLRLKRSVAVHLGPAEASQRVGTIARDIRVRWKRLARGPECQEPWVEIEPRGWVCGDYLEPTDKPTWGVELPRLGRGDIVPGVYGKVVTDGATTYAKPEDKVAGVVKRTLAGAVKVRREAEAEVDGETFWRIGKGEYLPSAAVRPFDPSTWQGVRLGDHSGLSLPVGFAYAARNRKQRVSVYDAPTGGKVVGSLAPRQVVSVLETAGGAHRIGDGRWVRGADLRVAERTEPPAALGEGERWVDVDTDRQVLVAYEGTTPVYATLVSSGSRKYPSETGVFRVWVKFSETDMNGQMGDDAPYSVATVPWTQFYAKDLALHTAYWHDKFGQPLSHGCVNLSPIDARFLYFWSEPSVPEGWSMAFGIVERPGSIVRVRNAADPDPEVKGYAKRVYEARLSRRSP